MNYTLREFCESNGNSSISKVQLFSLLDDALNFKDQHALYEEAVILLLSKDEIHETVKEKYAPSIYYNCETKILEFFENRKVHNHNKQIISDFETYIKRKKIV